MLGLAAAANLLSVPLAEADVTNVTRDLIVVAGQSNAVGFDATPEGLPADAGDKEVMFWWRCGDPPPDDHDSVSRGWTTLQPQPKSNPMAKQAGVPRQYGNFSSPAGGFGPELGLSRELHSKTNQPIAIVKVAFSGTGMTTDWDHQNAGPQGACYRALVEETKLALDKAAEQGIKLRLRALVWVQGESDANARNAPEYGKNLGEMIQALRADLNAPEMMALVGVNTNFGEGKNTFMPVIVQQQQELAKRIPRCTYVDTSGVTYANGAHFDTKSTIEIGRRFASALIAAEKNAVNGSAADARRTNILFIAVDDLRPELGCYGTPVIQSPNIDRLAKKGMVFDRAFCQQAVCSPSRTSLLTGTRPDTTEVWDLVTHFRKAQPDLIALPQLFKNHGYFTKSMGKIYHHGLDDTVSWSVPSFYPHAPHGAGARKADPDAPKVESSKKERGPVVEEVIGPDNALHDGELADMAIEALKELKGKPQQPFFLAVGFIKPHLPFNAPKKYFDLYDADKIPPAPNPFPPIGAPKYAVVPSGEINSYSGVPATRPFPEDFTRKLKHGYYACVSYMDAQVGRVLDELERQELDKNTIVILWGDHGWKLGEHQAWAKHSNVENDTRAPMIIYVPGIANAGTHTSALVEFVDIYPTLAELAELPLPKTLEGISFKPLIDDPQKPWKQAAFSQYPRKPDNKNLMGYTMRTDRYRLTRWVDRKDHSKVDAVELYDHQTDPQENKNIAGDPANKELVAKLTEQWLAGWRGSNPK